ncbi:MAG: DHH family phosphoesterase [archaeon]
MNLKFPFSSIYGKKVLLLIHRSADVDALSSSASLYLILKDKCDVSIGIPDSINSEAKNLAKLYSIPYLINPDLSAFDKIILLDLNSLDMLGSLSDSFANSKAEKFIIDHHEYSKEIVPRANAFIDADAISTSTILFNIFNANKISYDKNVAQLLLCGIITDSGNFYHADKETFIDVYELLSKSEKSYSEMLNLLSLEHHYSEKIARLKAMCRLSIFRVNEYIIVFSHIGSFSADIAQLFIKIGADVSIVFSEISKTELVLSARANIPIQQKESFDLVHDVIEPLQKRFSGRGGGHSGAAAFECNGNLEDVRSSCLELIKKRLAKGKKIEFKEYPCDTS